MTSDAGAGPTATKTWWLAEPAATEALGAALGAHLGPGTTVALLGDLGAGKTTFVRGLARGLRVLDPDGVASPTYLLVVEHDGPVPMLHMDAYLREKLAAFLADGGLDYLAERAGVTVVEWADRIADLLPSDRVEVELVPAPRGTVVGRSVRITGPTDLIAKLARAD